MDKYEKEWEEVERFNAAFDRYFKKIQKAEAKYKENNDISKLITFWENLWATEKVHNLSYKWAFRLVNIYMECEDYQNALKALHYIDNTPYYENNNALYNSYLNRITKKIKKAAPKSGKKEAVK